MSEDKANIENQTKYTPFQEAVITGDVNNILVSAAAGSGKTTVLVERIIRKLINDEAEIDSFLIATFTNAAANNMKLKIAKEIKKALKNSDDPNVRSHLKRQLEMLPNAYIQTLNAFCSRVIREKGFELVSEDSFIEPNMMIMGDQQLKILLERAAQNAIDSKYTDMLVDGVDADFGKAVDYLTNGRSDTGLQELLVSMYPRFRSMPNYVDTISYSYESRVKMDNEGRVIFLEEFNKKILDLFLKARNSAIRSKDLIDITVFAKDKKKNAVAIDLAHAMVDSVVTEAEHLEKLASGDISQEELFCEIKTSLNSVSTMSVPSFGGTDESVKVFASSCGAIVALILLSTGSAPRGTAKLAIPHALDKKFDSFIKSSIEDLLKLQKDRTVVIGVFKDLLLRMDQNYAQLKKRYHAMDFSDQEQFAYRILCNPDVAEYYRKKFKEIYVDEYQDNSRLQDAIIQCFSNKNVFMVGDVKQSIYKFRYADPTMFTEKMYAYDEDKGIEGRLYPLKNNFRSTPEILDFVNILFEQLMADKSEVDYSDNHSLLPAPDAKRGNSVPRVVIVRNTRNEDDSTEKNDSEDNESVENNINKSVELDFNGVIGEVERYIAMEDVELKDICILTRKTKASRQIARLLNQAGHKAVCSDARTIYDDPDIATLCALITLLGNEHRDECLLGVLLAGYRFSNFTVDELAKISVHSKKNDILYMNLIVRLREYAYSTADDIDKKLQERVINFISEFDNLRSESVILSISELIERIYAITGIKATMKHTNEGVEKFVVFKDWLCSNYSGDISAIAGMLDELKLKLGSDATMEYESQQTNAISCMTYHKSKGLEFKCVIVTDFASQDVDDSSAMLLFDSKKGFLCKDYLDDKVIKDKSFERTVYEDYSDFADWSETIRLFYVALTRAEKHLSIVTSLSVSADPSEAFYRLIETQDEVKFTRDFILKQKDRNSLFLAALARLTGANLLFEEIMTNGAIKVPTHDRMKNINFDAFDLEIIDSKDMSVVLGNVNTDSGKSDIDSVITLDSDGEAVIEPYAFEKSIIAPSKTTVSLLKKLEQSLIYDSEKVSEEESGEDDVRLPLNLEVPELSYFTDENEYSTSSAKGTLIHNLLRYMDFSNMLQKMEIKSVEEVIDEEIDFLKESSVVTDKMIPVIAEFKNNLIMFLNSDIFRRIANAEISNRAFFEKPIMFSSEIKDTPDYTIVQGVIDVLFYENDEAVIVDYKTDRIKETDETILKQIVSERHKTQLDLYASALEIAGIKVKEKIIWLIRSNKAISL